MKRKLFFITIFLFSLLCVGCNNDTSTTENTLALTTTESETTTETETTEILQENSQEIKDRISTLKASNADPNYIQINTGLSATIHYDTNGVSMTYFSCNTSSLYDFDNMYYFGDYSDNHSESYWLFIEKDQDNLIVQENENWVVQKDVIIASNEAFESLIVMPDDYFDLFFETLDFTKEDENIYSIVCSYDQLVNDPKFDEYMYGLSGLNASSEDIQPNIKYIFTDSSVSLLIDYVIYLDDDLVQRLTVSYTCTMSFPKSHSYFNYADVNYFHIPSEEISEYMDTYEVEDELKLYMESNKYYYVKYDLDPGYYMFSTDYLSEEIILFDTNMNEICADSFYKITESGTYYARLKLINSEKVILTAFQIPESSIGTIDNPIIAENTLSGSLSENVFSYHLIDVDAEGYVLKLTCTSKSNQNATLSTAYNGNYIGFGEGTERYIIVNPGADVILKFQSGRYTTDYTIEYEILPYTESTSVISDMPQLTICTTIEEINDTDNYQYLFFGPETGTLYVKFEITEAGNYFARIDYIIYTYWEDHIHNLPLQPLYDAEGNLLNESADLYTFLEPGIYYIELTWFEGYTCIATICIDAS